MSKSWHNSSLHLGLDNCSQDSLTLVVEELMPQLTKHLPSAHHQLAQALQNFGEPGTLIFTFIRAYYRTSSAIGAISESSQDYILCQMLHLEDQRAGKRAYTKGSG